MITTQHSQVSHVVYNAHAAHVALACSVTLRRQLTSALFGSVLLRFAGQPNNQQVERGGVILLPRSTPFRVWMITPFQMSIQLILSRH